MGNTCRHGTKNKYLEDEDGSRVNKAFSKVDESLHDVTTNAEQTQQQKEIEQLTSNLQAEIESRTVDNERMKEENTRLTSQLEQVIAERWSVKFRNIEIERRNHFIKNQPTGHL
ncbi:hypothetical protein DPMN_111962 [Dreissena polymorpha]|uniref:Uncharacterized protein n=1 Tax=Dreissena polymorpha TaxID=45954 RepID=A0A9D4KFI6_DREPO|nr:hypothetical protein DPMN_111962 [Dreissena polymorpha]